MRKQLNLKFLQVDFEECYCPMGCCRMVETVCKELGLFRIRFPAAFEAIGVRSRSEAETICRVVAALNGVDQSKTACVGISGSPIPHNGTISLEPSSLG